MKMKSTAAALLLATAVVFVSGGNGPASAPSSVSMWVSPSAGDHDHDHDHDHGSSGVSEVSTSEQSVAPPLQTVAGARLLDTRGPGTVDGLYASGGLVPDRGVIYVQVAGRGGVPADAHSAQLSLIAIGPQGDGFATMWPCASTSDPVPDASVLNYRSGWVRANGVMTALGATGGVCVFFYAATHAVVDVQAFSTSNAVQTVTPVRVVDTRKTEIFAPGEVRRFDISNRAGDAPAAYLNLTSTGNSDGGFATIWPCASVSDPMPDSSVLNHVPYSAVANNTLTGLLDGGFCVYSYSSAHIIADLMGFLTSSASEMRNLSPYRVADTRSDGVFRPSSFSSSGVQKGILYAGEVRMFQIAGASNIAGRDPIPSEISGVVANFTAVNPSEQGFLTVWACDSVDDKVPNTSMLNFNTGWTATPNSSVQMLSGSGSICVYSSTFTGLLIDVSSVIVDTGPPSIMGSVVSNPTLSDYEVRVYTCMPTTTSEMSWMHDPAVHSSPEAAAAYLNSSGAFDFTRDLFEGAVNFTATAGFDYGSCDNYVDFISNIDQGDPGNIVHVIQHVERDAEASAAGWATMFRNHLTMNIAVDFHTWDSVFAHEFGHAVLGWGHPSYSPEANDYSNTFDTMSHGSSHRFYAHRLLETGIADVSNFEVFDGQETTFDLHVNPSGSSHSLAPDQTIGIFAPVAEGVTHPGLPGKVTGMGVVEKGNLAVVIEGLDRGSSVLGPEEIELRNTCADSASAWKCTGVIFSVIEHSGGYKDIGSIMDVAASGAAMDFANNDPQDFERTFVVRVGETRDANGMSITVNSFDRDTGVFSVTLDGLISEDFGREGIFFPL